MVDLLAVTKAIVTMGVKVAWKKAKRREAVIKLLRQFKIDPSNPPTDFDSIYTYTLIEYGIDRPEPILNFFRNEYVREAFHQSFYKNDPSILNREAEDIIQWNEETKELGIIDYDPRREFAAFSAVFHALVDGTRTPVEVKQNRLLNNIQYDLHQMTDEVVERLDALVTLHSVREERDRIVQVAPIINELYQQMKTWFTTLNYGFESHNEQHNGYFEWIINVPARRGYDRILVRGIEGEAKVGHVVALHEAVDKYKTNEGWMVAFRRISQAARDEVKKPENKGLFCYTFDELLDENANFDVYLKWLEQEVKHRGIDTMYVPLACTKEEFDLGSKQKIGEALYDGKNGWLEGYIDRWLDDPSKEHISVLGEFGTGKTWFTLHYAWISMRRYCDAKARGVERPRLPLIVPLRDYAKAVSVESLFSEFFFRKHEIPLPGYSAFEQLNRMGKLLLIFDGFDEMADRVDRQKMINNFWELASVVVPRSKVILTCRTEHFPEAKEGRALLNAELQASTSKLTGEPPQFEVLELMHFDNSQIRQALTLRTKPDIVEQVMSNKELLDLARRPVMTELILEALPAIEAGKSIDLSRVYLYAVRHKMERDITNQRTFTSLADKLYFLCELSWEMLSTNKMSLNYRYFPDRLRNLFGSIVVEQKDLDHWHFDMMGQTLLIRNADGDYTPAHRSFLEFFVAYKFAAELGILAPDFIELARAQSSLDTTLKPTDYTWSSYFQRQTDKNNNLILVKPLKNFVTEEIHRLVATVGSQPLAKAVKDLMCNMFVSDKMGVKVRLLNQIEVIRSKNVEETRFAVGNIASILIALDASVFKGYDLSSFDLKAANLTSANLTGCNLNHANLSGADLSYANLTGCNLNHANLSGADLRCANLTGCNLNHANLSHTNMRSTKLIDATLRGCEMHEIELHILNSWWRSQRAKEGFISFIYPYAQSYQSKEMAEVENQSLDFLKEEMDLRNNEIILVYVKNKEVQCKKKIHSLNIVESIVDFDSDKLRFLTIEGPRFSLDLANQEMIVDEATDLLTWHQADLTEAIGIGEQNAYLLKILGAVHTPPTSYIPLNDLRSFSFTYRTGHEEEAL